MRMVFACPLSFTPASRMVERVDQESHEPLADFGGRSGHAEVAGLRDGEARIAAGVDRREGSEVHVNVEREPMVRPTPRYPYARRRTTMSSTTVTGPSPPRGGRRAPGRARRAARAKWRAPRRSR